jgi:hypothetical protein
LFGVNSLGGSWGLLKMKAQGSGIVGSSPMLTAVFVDYDNIYMSLRRKSEEAAKRFAKDAVLWIKEIESGRLITLTNGAPDTAPRRIVMNRCYGNPVPRRNGNDNSTDMNSFPFVRHHYLRAGFEVVDCPPLTAQLKNSADIRMVMDVRDYLDHRTHFDEFILLSGDADFTPVLHRLRAHARRTIVFANDHTAAPYTALSDGEVREQDLINLLLEGRLGSEAEPNVQAALTAPVRQTVDMGALRAEIIREVVSLVRSAGQPVPLEALADRAVRTLGHDRTVGTSWAGTGGFRELLTAALPHDIRLTDQSPYFVFDTARQEQARQPLVASPAATAPPRPETRTETRAEPRRELSYEPTREPRIELPREPRLDQRAAPEVTAPAAQMQYASMPVPPMAPPVRPAAPRQQFAAPPELPAQPPRAPGVQSMIQQSIARIHDACQAPPLSPPEYRALFEVMADEINTNNLTGNQTFVNIELRAREIGVELRREDIRFVLDVVSEPDRWFEQGASANLFSSRFRNFVVARCRSQGLNLSADELDLIEAWFGGSPIAQRPPAQQAPVAPPQQPARAPQAPVQQAVAPPALPQDRWWSLDEGREHVASARNAGIQDEDFPRIIRSRLRG